MHLCIVVRYESALGHTELDPYEIVELRMIKRLFFAIIWGHVFAAGGGFLMGVVGGILCILQDLKLLHLSLEAYAQLGMLTGSTAILLGCLGFILCLSGKLPTGQRLQ